MTEQKSYYTLFDPQSVGYSRYRPGYPDELFDFLANQVVERQLAWDVGTGSGQAALMLAERFSQVLATDSSEKQLSLAPLHERISYRVAPAERSGLDDSSCDLVVVASAVHWFDRETFFSEAKRTLKQGGVIAVWCYSLVNPPAAVKEEIEEFYGLIAPFWPGPIQLVIDRYRDLEFPFEEIDAPSFSIREEWTLERLFGFYASWSAVQEYKSKSGNDPVVSLAKNAEKKVPLDSPFEINLPLYMRVGRCIKEA